VRAVLCRRRDKTLVATFEDIVLRDPAPADRDLLVEICAVGLNPLDRKRRAARPDQDDSGAVLGWDAAGVVVGVGPEATSFSQGDAVFYAGSIARPGCQSALHLVDERLVAAKPAGLDFAAAAALPLGAVTASEALYDHLRLDTSSRGTILINGGAGGVAVIAVRLARALPDVTVIATASRSETRDLLLGIGAHFVVDHRGDMAAQVRMLGISRVDWIMSMFTSETAWRSYAELIAPFGNICLVDHPPALDFAAVKAKSVGIHWQSMFTRPVHQTADMASQGDYVAAVARAIHQKKLHAPIVRVVGRIDAAGVTAAHALLERGDGGKLVLEGFGS
jgi:NADPH2:quinone reductase